MTHTTTLNKSVYQLYVSKKVKCNYYPFQWSQPELNLGNVHSNVQSIVLDFFP